MQGINLLWPFQSMANSLLLKYKLIKSLFLWYLFVEVFTLLTTSVAALTFGVQTTHAFLAFIVLSILYTFFFFISLAYLLYNLFIKASKRM